MPLLEDEMTTTSSFAAHAQGANTVTFVNGAARFTFPDGSAGDDAELIDAPDQPIGKAFTVEYRTPPLASPTQSWVAVDVDGNTFAQITIHADFLDLFVGRGDIVERQGPFAIDAGTVPFFRLRIQPHAAIAEISEDGVVFSEVERIDIDTSFLADGFFVTGGNKFAVAPQSFVEVERVSIDDDACLP